VATIAGSVMLRPPRLGLLVARPTLGDVQKAVEAATSSWGGIYFPIIDVPGFDDLDRRLERWSVDVLWPLTTDGPASALAERPGFRWMGRSPYGPFDPPRDSLSARVLDASWMLSSPGLKLVLPRWAETELATFFAVWFGSFGQDADGRTRRDRFAAQVQGSFDAELGGSFDPPVEGLTPIESTGFEITYQGDSPGVGIVLIDPNEPNDLLRYWNLRASGGKVLPWPLGHEQLIERFARSWLLGLIADDQLPKWIRGDGKPLPPHVTVWSTQDHAGRARPVEELLNDVGLHAVAGDDSLRSWTGIHPMTTSFIRSFNTEVAPRAAGVSIPLPALPWPPGYRRGRWPGIVAADISIFGEHGLVQERTMAVPRVRRLADLLGRPDVGFGSFRRPNGEGGIYAVQADEESVRVPLVRPVAVLDGLFDEPDWRFSQSEDGQFASRLAEILSNPTTSAASQPAIREVLLQAARRSDTGMPFDALLQAAINARGNWPDMLTRQTPKEYGRSLLLWLLERKLLRMVLPVTCTSCRSRLILGPDELDTEVRCSFCDETFPLAFPVAEAGRKSDWHYRIAGHVPESRLKAALPVLAVTSLLGAFARGGTMQSHAMGTEIASPGRRAEFDIATIADSFIPQVVLGEVKSHHPVDRNDIDNLAWAQEHLRGKRIECYILIATLNDSLSRDEVVALRNYCEQAKELLRANGSITPLALPIVLTQQELSVNRFDDKHPTKWSERGRGLSSVALASCQQKLGLRAVRPVQSEGKLAYEFEWDELSGN
jgi:hypothetical protein